MLQMNPIQYKPECLCRPNEGNLCSLDYGSVASSQAKRGAILFPIDHVLWLFFYYFLADNNHSLLFSQHEDGRFELRQCFRNHTGISKQFAFYDSVRGKQQ
jgi:hypothetical protein